MSSPVEISFSQLIKIDRRKSDAVYLQIVYQVIHAIQRRILVEGQQLPGSRVLSLELGVHRKTVVAALNELQAQGWLSAKANVGTFVCYPEGNTGKAGFAFSFPEKAGFGFRKSYILDTPDDDNDCPYRFTAGEPDYRIIKTDELARFYSVALKRKKLIGRIPEFRAQGNIFFKKQLSYYINQTKGFHIAPDNLLTAQSKEVILYILSQLLIRTGDIVLVPELSYHFANMVFRQAGATLKTIPMDRQGIKVDFIRKLFTKGDIRAVYVHPQHQYPTTVNLTEGRRLALAALADEYGFVIIEDDTDGELSYEKAMTPPLAKMTTKGNVIYLGAFGQFLPPGFQVNFMTAPKDFIDEAGKYLNIFSHTDFVKEQALGEMIYEGDIHRYRRKALNIYLSRRDNFAQLLKTHLPNQIDINIPTGGLAFWLPFKEPFSLNRLAAFCQEKGLFLPRICLYQNQKITALRLGFGHLNEEEMPEVVKILSAAIQRHLT